MGDYHLLSDRLETLFMQKSKGIVRTIIYTIEPWNDLKSRSMHSHLERFRLLLNAFVKFVVLCCGWGRDRGATLTVWGGGG